MNRVFGVDFSGARDAGRKIWIAEARGERARPAEIISVFSMAELTEGEDAPEVAVPALASFIADQVDAVIGCDFPFGLPRNLVDRANWLDFAIEFARHYPNPDAFREKLRDLTERREFKRETDLIARTPFNSYNLRLYRQTWWGIAAVLAPLVKERKISVAPQLPKLRGRPQVIEVCAASTLKSIGFYPAYKGRGTDKRQARLQIVRELNNRGQLRPLPRAIKDLLVEDAGGDALDAVIGAIAVARANLTEKPSRNERIEGRVYFAI